MRGPMRALLALMILIASTQAAAEVRLRAGVEIYETLLRTAEEEWRLLTTGSGSVTFEAVGSRNVRGEISLSIPASVVALPEVDRAFIRFRLPWFRMTLGAAPMSWGEGLLINAGDFPNAAYDPTTDLLTGDFRADPVWQAQLYVPLGPFSFIEAALLPALVDPFAATIPELSETRVGTRAYIDADAVAVQLGYLFEDPAHRVYASVQGALGADLYLVVAHQIDSATTDLFEDVRESLVFSGGGFYTVGLGRDVELALRLEAQITPADLRDDLATASTLAATADLALSPTLSFGLQSLLAPTDPSALLAASVSWNLDQGLTLLTFAQANFGASDTLFATDSDGGLSITLGARYVY